MVATVILCQYYYYGSHCNTMSILLL